MGDIADMMLEGVLCECCGEYLGEGDGYPQKCSGCQRDANIDAHNERQGKARKVKCGTCGRKVKEIGLKDHMRDAHAQSGSPPPNTLPAK